jgi:hypothetical protein
MIVEFPVGSLGEPVQIHVAGLGTCLMLTFKQRTDRGQTFVVKLSPEDALTLIDALTFIRKHDLHPPT